MNFSFRLVFFFLLGWFVASLFRCAPTKRAGEFDNDRSGNIPIGFGGAVGGLGGSGSGGTFGAAAIAADMDSVREVDRHIRSVAKRRAVCAHATRSSWKNWTQHNEVGKK